MFRYYIISSKEIVSLHGEGNFLLVAYEKNLNLWFVGELSGISGKTGKASLWIKKYLIEIREHKCEICGTKKWMKQPVPLVLDHIDGHFENNNEENLRLVCGNCDMQLSTYKSKNIGNGRPR